jgi:flagellar basal-body rod modification protein FlgD
MKLTSAGKLVIDIAAENAKTQALLTGQTDRLVQALGLQNVQVESVTAANPASFGQQQSAWTYGDRSMAFFMDLAGNGGHGERTDGNGKEASSRQNGQAVAGIPAEEAAAQETARYARRLDLTAYKGGKINMADSTVNGVSEFLNTMSASGTSRKDNQSLSMDDFFQLMVAQLKNQDMFSPTDNTQMINQMAQFSIVNALTDMKALTSTTYSMSLIGKQATVAFMDDNGQLQSVTGLIEGVNLYGGAEEVVIGGKSYGLSNIMSVTDAGKNSTENALVSNAGLIGMIATAMRGTDTGIETVRGRIEQLKLADGEVWAYIDGKSYRLSELSELAAAPDPEEEASDS